MSNQNLVTMLNSRIDKLSNLDQKWVIFITDHKKYIINDSNIVFVNDADRDRYRNKFDHYLSDKGCDKSIRWIGVMINDTASYEDFTSKPVIYIPNKPYIVNLYRMYRTSENLQ